MYWPSDFAGANIDFDDALFSSHARRARTNTAIMPIFVQTAGEHWLVSLL